MSVLTVTVDTDSGEISASIDGKNIENVVSASVYKDDYARRGLYASISVAGEKIGDAMKHTHYCIASAKYAEAEKLKKTATENIYLKA